MRTNPSTPTTLLVAGELPAGLAVALVLLTYMLITPFLHHAAGTIFDAPKQRSFNGQGRFDRDAANLVCQVWSHEPVQETFALG